MSAPERPPSLMAALALTKAAIANGREADWRRAAQKRLIWAYWHTLDRVCPDDDDRLALAAYFDEHGPALGLPDLWKPLTDELEAEGKLP